MKARNRNVALVVKPDDHSVALGVDAGMIGAGDSVSLSAAGYNGEWFKRASLQKLTNISNHLSPAVETKLGLIDAAVNTAEISLD